MEKKITIDEWIDIATEVIEDFANKFSDDGKITVRDGFGLVLTLLKGIAKAYKN